MGLKLNLIIGGIAIILFSGSLWYINYLQDQIAILKGNQIILEKEIEEQNAEILNMIAQNNKQNTLILEMEKDKNEAEREVNKLRDTFARHDLDNLALAKPGLIQTRVNNATKRVKDDLILLTNPEQFDEEETDTNN